MTNGYTQELKEGDIVNFFSTVVMWQKEYKSRNPGVILKLKGPNQLTGRKSATILWADGSISDEHASYLGSAALSF